MNPAPTRISPLYSRDPEQSRTAHVGRFAPHRVENSKYFWYHHTAADTVDKLDADEVQRSVAAMAVFAYVVAEMPERLPR